MNDISGDEKEVEVTPETNSEEPKKPVDLDDTISRLLRRKADVNAGKDSSE
jgi:hypothetical protein